uniref:Uncharacterized protein n=1 Tax=Knipowitschia caucasica TaxID=637954 RepID=A0AAV2M6V0_KNICA
MERYSLVMQLTDMTGHTMCDPDNLKLQISTASNSESTGSSAQNEMQLTDMTGHTMCDPDNLKLQISTASNSKSTGSSAQNEGRSEFIA